ncbi:Peptidyl-prolyl cis-trans isomerase D [Pontiella sulfatireligans]|uniref:peptidylprolyl isomerase n=2 Tax=Pontiella sulfatireligans TaxID=2750658 RepID=A0A6C2UNF2_9BACT|nr:Peptidyl-prolyl cis-trans isomerase D [Pontiella sulfatireligans]
MAVLGASAVRGQTNTAPKRMSIEIDGYAARVNEQVITRGEVREAMAPIMPELYRAYQGDELTQELEKAFNQTREKLVERALIMETYTAKGGAIPDQYVNDEIKRMINTRFKGDAAQFEEVLASQKKTREEYMDMIREKMAVDYMIGQEVYSRARITPEQVREEYESKRDDFFIPAKVKYSVIVLNKGETEEDQAVKREEAEKTLAKLLEGSDFNQTAIEVSEGSRAADGGAFPWMQPKDVRVELQEALATLPAGEISGIVETEEQLYILKVDARRQPGYKTFDEVRADIKSMLTAKERERLRKRWIERLKQNNYIVIYN